ncbi:unnamed protein product [Candidula unifasciata]|uniref:Uncharacterized protein n=1 Tax=Candidula unifasciata TaxID=100452 RepID=A0A8S3YNF1_9EUPU|nr:unnamed protein product [Candidula unifasciata]
MTDTNLNQNLRATSYRLQTTAYANRWGASRSPTKIEPDNGRYDVSTPHHLETLSRSRGHFNTKSTTDFLFNHIAKQRSTSLQQLSVIDSDLIFDHLPSFEDKRQSSSHKQSYSSQLSFPLSSESVMANPQNKLRPITARLSTTQAPVSTVSRHRRRRFSLEEDPTKVAMKISLPCTGGCCYCVFSALLGPVKVYITRADKPKKEPLLLRIKDGNGKPVIPVSRKSDVRGLVYDPVSFSLHPPVKGRRPMVQKQTETKKGIHQRPSRPLAGQ